jgi:flagella basal body P-ring formation protein FlgA
MRIFFVGILIIIAVFTAVPVSATVHQQVDSALAEALQNAVNEPDAKIQVRKWKTSDSTALENGQHLQSLDLLTTERPYGKVTARARIQMKNGRAEQVFVIADVDVTVPVWVVVRRLGRGAPLNEFSIRSEHRSMARLSASALRTNVIVKGHLAARPLLVGTVLTKSSTKTPRLVHRGAPVLVTVHVGNVIVRGSGSAIASAGLGETVSVRLNKNKRVITATVDGPGKVSVHR